MFTLDSKNYHVWSYRQWLVQRFDLWDDRDEWAYVKLMIEEDVRNNSAWNHRWYLCFGQYVEEEQKEDGVKVVDEDVVDREMKYAMEKVDLAPTNESPWNYLRGVMGRGDRERKEIKAWVEGFTGEAEDGEDDGVRSLQAVEWLAECEEADAAGGMERAKRLFTLLEELDPIRKGYWGYRKRLMDEKWEQE